MAGVYAEELDVSPWDALLQEVRRSAARCRWLDDAVRDAAVARGRTHVIPNVIDPETPTDAGIPYKLLRESREERRHLAVVAKAAIDAGVAERIVRRYELEGGLVAAALIAGLDALTTLSPEDRLRALEAAQTALDAEARGLPAAGDDGPSTPDAPPAFGS